MLLYRTPCSVSAPSVSAPRCAGYSSPPQIVNPGASTDRTWGQEVVGSILSLAHGVKTLGKFLTPMCLCHQTVKVGIAYWPKGGDERRLGSGKVTVGWWKVIGSLPPGRL